MRLFFHRLFRCHKWAILETRKFTRTSEQTYVHGPKIINVVDIQQIKLRCEICGDIRIKETD